MNKVVQGLIKAVASMMVVASTSYAPPAWGQALCGGGFTSAPAAASWAPGRLDTFVRGPDSALWHQAGDWSRWENLGGYLTSAPAVAAWGPERLDVFVRGGDYALYHKLWDSSVHQWADWEDLGGYLSSAPAVASTRPGRLDVFVLGGDGTLFTRSWDSQRGYSWSDWTSLGQPPQSGSWRYDPAAATSRDGGGVDVFLVGPNHDVLSNRLPVDSGPAWSPSAWTSWGGYVQDSPAAVSWPGHTEIFVIGGGDSSNRPLYTRSKDDTAGFSSYQPLGGSWPTAPGATAQSQAGADYFLVNPADQSLQHRQLGQKRVLNIVAHHDDDLVFMNPDVQADIAGGAVVQTIFVVGPFWRAGKNIRGCSIDCALPTSDENPCPSPCDQPYERVRELGAQAAYAHMAGIQVGSEVSDTPGLLSGWNVGCPDTVLDKKVVTVTPTLAPNLSLVFLRLGNFTNQNNIVTEINELWEGTVSTIKSQNLLPDPSRVTISTYTREDVISVLAELIRQFNPDLVRIQDSTDDELSTDNPDHRGTAKFAHEALGRVPVPYTQYQGYAIDGYSPNLLQSQHDLKHATFAAYGTQDVAFDCSTATCDPTWGDYEERMWKQYEVP